MGLFSGVGDFIGDLGSSFDDSFHSIGNGLDNLAHGDLSDAGNYLGQSISDFEPAFGVAGDLGEYVGDVAQVGGFHGEDLFKKVKNNPLQLLFGIDPLGTKIGNKVFNKDWTPGTTMLGGVTNETYQNAENEGIDTSNARGLGQFANLIASFYGGGATSAAAGGGALGGAAAGAALGGVNALDNGTSFGKGIYKGALGGGLANGMDFGGSVGIDNPLYKQTFNGAIGGGLGAGVKGESIANGAALGAGGSFLKGYTQNMNNDSMFPQGGMSYSPYEGQNDWMGQMQGQSIPSVNTGGMPQQPSVPDWIGTGSINPVRPEQKQSPFSQLQQNPWFRGLTGLAGGLSPAAGKTLDSVGMGANTFDTVGRTLGSLYTQNRARKDAQAQMNRMDVLRGAYRDDMMNRLSRKDAMSHRRSQYGPREVELMARMAELDSKNAPHLQGLYDQRRAANVGALNDAFTGVRRLGGPEAIYNGISNYFGQ